MRISIIILPQAVHKLPSRNCFAEVHTEAMANEANEVPIEWQVQTEVMATYQSFCTILPRAYMPEVYLEEAVADMRLVDNWIFTHMRENDTQWWAHISIGDLTHVLKRMPLSEEAVEEIMYMTQTLQDLD